LSGWSEAETPLKPRPGLRHGAGESGFRMNNDIDAGLWHS
jgi:hypothetical protein